jgi:AraC-like DNA-binding protein
MEINFAHTIELLATFQSVMFAFYLLFSNKAKSSTNYFMAVFLIIFGINTANFYIDSWLQPLSENWYVFINTFFFLLPSCLFLYTKHSLFPVAKLTPESIIHVIPFLLYNAILIPVVYLENYKENPQEFDFQQYLLFGIYIAFYVLIFTYQVISFKLLREKKLHYLENYSSADLRSYRYLYQLNIIFTLMFVLSAIKNYFSFQFEGPEISILVVAMKFSLLVFFCWIIYQCLQTPELFHNTENELPSVKKMLEEDKRDTKDTLIDEATKEQIEKIKTYMVQNEPYLESSLSLYDLAQQTSMQAKDLSLLINSTLNQHFFDFVNQYRISKAMQMLQDPSKKELTVLEILYAVGFNSKSSFNTAFKKQTHLTPTEYRKKYM